MKKEYTNEIWKPIKGYEKLYEISNYGRVKSLPRKIGFVIQHEEKILNTYLNKFGYLKVRLTKNYIGKNYFVHRLVAEAFLDNPLNLPCVNHKDECKTNNHVSNLEFCTQKYNCNYGTAIARRVEKSIISLSKPVLQFDKQGNLIREWSSISEACRNGYTASSICQCCQGKRKSHKGFIWRYK